MKRKNQGKGINLPPVTIREDVPVIFSHNGRDETALWYAQNYANHATVRPFKIGSPCQYCVSWKDVLAATSSSPLRVTFPWQSLTPASPTAIGGNSERICSACYRSLGRNPHVAVTSDGQIVKVGSECFKQITPSGFHPPKGGSVLYRGRFSPSGQLIEIIKA